MTGTLESLRELLREKFDIAAENLDETAPIVDSGIDSLALTELLFEVEDRFGVVLLDATRDIQSLADLARVIDSKLREPPLPPVCSPSVQS